MILGKKIRKRKDDPHARRFGVEIECGLSGGVNAAAELFNISWDGDWDSDEEDSEDWSVCDDGSGVELRTPILQGEAGFERLRWAMDRLKDAGAFVTPADGLHVHHDAPEFEGNASLCVQLVNSWRNNQTSINELVHPRRRENGACPSWSDGYYKALMEWYSGEYPELRATRNDLNLAALREHGSIEIRLHEGTLDCDVAIAWIMFGQRFIHEVLRNTEPLPAEQNDAALMTRIRLSDEAQAILDAKKNNSHDSPGSQYRPRRY